MSKDKPTFSVDQINVVSVKAYYDKSSKTEVNETDNLFYYTGQFFRCYVQVQIMESDADHNWSIGLVQACDRTDQINRYGEDGSTFWELHPLKSRRHKMVNDGDGKQYPFYNSTSKYEIRSGQVHDSSFTLHYSDHIRASIVWELPFCGGARLTETIRRQDFWVWLVAIKRFEDRNTYAAFDDKKDSIYVLKTLRWRFNVHITFDPHMPVGQRIKNIKDIQDEQPTVFDYPNNKPVPMSAFNPPNCNVGQSLIWYPNKTSEQPELITLPKQIIVPWNSWMSDMTPNRKLNVPRSKECKLVNEWKPDKEILISYRSNR